jgi:hypothetical protein
VALQPPIDRQQVGGLDYYVISTSLPSWRTDALGAAPRESIPHRHRELRALRGEGAPIASIENPEVIGRILAHLEQRASAPAGLIPAQGPRAAPGQGALDLG